MDEPKPNQTEQPFPPQLLTPERIKWIQQNWLEFQERHIKYMVQTLTEGVIPALLGPVMTGYQSLLMTIDARDKEIERLEQEVDELRTKLAMIV